MEDCLFCKIIAGEIPGAKVYEDDDVFAFRDIAPKAPVHVLCVPKQHIACADDIDASNSALIARIFEAIPKIAAPIPSALMPLKCFFPKDSVSTAHVSRKVAFSPIVFAPKTILSPSYMRACAIQKTSLIR